MNNHETRGWRLGMCTVVLLVLFAAPLPALSQVDTLAVFNAGHVHVSGSFAGHLLSGPGGSTVVLGANAPGDPDPNTLFLNPAALVNVPAGPLFAFSFRPPLHLPRKRIPFDVHGGVHDQMNTLADDYLVRSHTRSRISDDWARDAQAMASFALTFRWGPLRLGAGYDRPLHADLGLELGGTDVRIVSGDTTQTAASLNLSPTASGRLSVDMTRWTVSAAFPVTPHFSLGAGMAFSRISAELGGAVTAPGTVTYGDTTQTFHDPSAPWYPSNAPGARMDGAWKGSIFTWRGGAVYRGRDQFDWRIGALVTVHTPMTLKGSFGTTVQEYAPLELNAGPWEDPFDPGAISDTTRLTRTMTNRSAGGQYIQLTIPWSIALSVGSGEGIRPNFTATVYMGERLAWSTVLREHDAGQPVAQGHRIRYSRGFDPRYQLYYSVRPAWFFFGLGYLFGYDYSQGFLDGNDVERQPIDDGYPVILPRLDAGLSWPATENLTVELVAVALPEDLVRLNLVYRL